jgi:hypothetical protein
LEPLTNGQSFSHPYQRYELLTKIFNNLTTRSNVFAIWMTVGFFEVKDDTVLPVKLGAEIGRAENRNIRHRMFAIVDRTNMQIWPTYSNAANTTPTVKTNVKIDLPVNNGVSATSVNIGIDANVLSTLSGNNSDTQRAWAIQENSVLVFEPDTDNEETVTVQKDQNGKLFAVFIQSHPANSIVISRGNPGPWKNHRLNYDPRQDTKVVPYFTLID